MPIDFTSPRGQVRLLINDTVEGSPVFPDGELDAYLALEGDNVKRAAAQCLDTIADDEALTSKVIKTQDLNTDGTKVADSLRKRAAALRAQADRDDNESDDGAFFDIVPIIVPMNPGSSGPELTEHPVTWL